MSCRSGAERRWGVVERPDFVTDEHLDFLDDLRESGVTNMYGAASYVYQAYPGLTERESQQVLAYWMDTFSERYPANAR